MFKGEIEERYSQKQGTKYILYWSIKKSRENILKKHIYYQYVTMSTVIGMIKTNTQVAT